MSDPLWKGSRIWFAESEMPLITMKSDASGHIAWGYHIGDFEEMCAWTEDELPKTIQFKELYLIVCAARRLGPTFSDHVVRAGVDNTGVVYMINKGSSKDPDCMRLLIELYGFCEGFNQFGENPYITNTAEKQQKSSFRLYELLDGADTLRFDPHHTP